ncbi:MAG: chemotaxis protein CheD [Firmicutes bacterium]|nr:chemotaxis protein CheD [Bacillota bacterium]
MIVTIGMAQCAFGKVQDTLVTVGLGSCVGVVLYEPQSGLAGLAHVMLPEAHAQDELLPGKYADTAVAHLFSELLRQQVNRSAIRAKLAGGAQMFSSRSGIGHVRIGTRNVEAILAQLEQRQIPVIAADVGGSCGRTLSFVVATGVLTVQTALAGSREI